MTYFVAKNLISQNPERKVAFTGRYDQMGEPVLRSVRQKIKPGSVFQLDDAKERDWYLSLDAIRPMSEDEIFLWESGTQIEFPVEI